MDVRQVRLLLHPRVDITDIAPWCSAKIHILIVAPGWKGFSIIEALEKLSPEQGHENCTGKPETMQTSLKEV